MQQGKILSAGNWGRFAMPEKHSKHIAITADSNLILKFEPVWSIIAKRAVEAGERMKQVAAQAMEEYIDYFTEPIWERGDEEDEEEEEE